MSQSIVNTPNHPRKFDPYLGWMILTGCLVFISLGKQVATSKNEATPTVANKFRVDLNHASLAELMALPNLGPATASKIVEYRREKGPFSEVDHLIRVSGIGPETLRSLRPLLRVGPSEDMDDSLVRN
jgi:comEA protein